MCACGCNCDHGLGVLEALTADQAVETIFPTAKVRSGAGHNQSIRDQMLASVNAGQIVGAGAGPDYVPGTGECQAAAGSGGSATAQKLSLAAGVGGIGLQLVAKAGFIAAGPAGWIALGVSSIVGIFSTILNHHAQAVKKEQSILCSAVPAANNYLEIIAQGVSQGMATPQDAIRALDSLVSDFEASVGPIIHGSDPTSSGECNAACVELSKLRAIVAEDESMYQDMISAQSSMPSVATPVVRPNTVVSPGGGVPPQSSYASFYQSAPAPARAPALPGWLPIAAVAVGYLLLRE